MMTDKDVQREIEENQRRARPESEVGLDEDVIRERENENDGTILDDLGNALLGDDRNDRQREVEYDDNNKSTRLEPK